MARRTEGSVIELRWDEAAAEDFRRALDAAGRALRRDLAKPNRQVGRYMAKLARQRAPRSARRSRASLEYGPLSRAKGMGGRGDAARAGVKAAYYYNFVRAGKAGRKRVAARPFLEQAIGANEREIFERLAKGVRTVMQRHLNVSVEVGEVRGVIRRGTFR